MYKDAVKRAYATHKGDAKRRGIPFLLTYEQWCMVWMESGKFEQRGRHRGNYVMRRFGDKGGYELGNVEICVARENTAERNRLNPMRGEKHPHYGKFGKIMWKDASRLERMRQKIVRVAATRRRDARGCFITEKSNGTGLPPVA